MTKLVPIDFTAPNAAKLFTDSLHETGFGVLKNHPINPAQVSSIYAHWADFFNSPEKEDYLYSKEKQDGFFPSTVSEIAKGQTLKDLKEYYHIYPWGRVPPALEAEAMDYYNSTNSLAATLLQWVEECSPQDIRKAYSEPLPSMIEDSPLTLLRVLHYPPLAGGEEPGAIRAAAHGDINLMTILPAANEPGLQVLSTSGEWIDVPCEFGTLIVNIGDMLQEASQGYYPSTVHRVINPEGTDHNTSRFSLPFFLHPRNEVVLSERYTAGKYLNERLKELGVL